MLEAVPHVRPCREWLRGYPNHPIVPLRQETVAIDVPAGVMGSVVELNDRINNARLRVDQDEIDDLLTDFVASDV